MNILVCSRISIPAKDRTLPAWQYLRSLGHNVVVKHPGQVEAGEQPDAIISMGVTIMEETIEARRRWPKAPLFCYNWDTYAWVWDNPRPGEYDYKKYGELLKTATEVWVPSECTGRRCKQWWGINHWHVILSACPWWEWPARPGQPCDLCGGGGRRAGHSNETCPGCCGDGLERVRDDGYALCTLREIPDPWWGKFEQACRQLGIDYRMTRHEVSYEEYQAQVAHCRLLVSPLYELSTGGLTLMEGYYHGKPCLLSDSPWHGGRDYMRNVPGTHYFDHTSFDDFAAKLRWAYDYYASNQLDVAACRPWVRHNYSDERMIDDMLRRIKACMTRG